jgi:DNA repair protein RecO (recombination protein O)
MRTIMRMSLDNMHLFRMSRVERNRCAEIILYYYRLHQSDFPELRSIEVLKELF